MGDFIHLNFKSVTLFFFNYLSLIYISNYSAGRPIETLNEGFKDKWMSGGNKENLGSNSRNYILKSCLNNSLSVKETWEYLALQKKKRNMKNKKVWL